MPAISLWLIRVIFMVVLPGLATWAIVRHVVPSRIEGAVGGATGALARFADDHPLLLAVVLFAVLAETGRYWSAWLTGKRAWPPAVEFGDVPATASTNTRRHWVRRLAKPAGIVRFMAVLAVIVAAALVCRTSVVEIFRVAGPSMLPTLDPADRLIVNKMAYGFRLPFVSHRWGSKLPRRGDVVVFRARDANGPGTIPLVKRVVGLPGDRMGFQDGRPAVNGWMFPLCDVGPFVSVVGGQAYRGRLGVEFVEDRWYLVVWNPGEQPFPEYVVKPNELFVAGDHRGASRDSRLWLVHNGLGAGVPTSALEGRVNRLALGGRSDGRLDFSRFLAPLNLHLRQPGANLPAIEKRIATCLQAKRPPTSPPANSAKDSVPSSAARSKVD